MLLRLLLFHQCFYGNPCIWAMLGTLIEELSLNQVSSAIKLVKSDSSSSKFSNFSEASWVLYIYIYIYTHALPCTGTHDL